MWKLANQKNGQLTTYEVKTIGGPSFETISFIFGYGGNWIFCRNRTS